MRSQSILVAVAMATFVMSSCGSTRPARTEAEPVPRERHRTYPDSPQETVTETMHGHTVPDPYRWLEEDAAPRVVAWTAAQNAFTAAHLARSEDRQQLECSLEEAFEVGSLGTPTVAGGRAFWTERRADQNQTRLMTRLVDGNEAPRVLIDGDALSKDGTIAIDWFYPSPSGRLLAYGLSESGNEASVLHVLDVQTGHALPTRIPGTRFASLAWSPDEGGFFYTRYPLAGTRYWAEVGEDDARYNRHVYWHRLGTDHTQDLRIFGDGMPREDWPNVSAASDGKMVVITQHRGWSESKIFARAWSAKPNAEWAVVADREGSREHPLPTNEHLFVFTNHDAPRGRVLRISWKNLDVNKAEEIIPSDPTRVMEGVQVIGGLLAVHWLHEASSQLELFDHDGKLVRSVALPTLGSVTGMGGERRRGDLFYGFSSYVTAPVVYRASPKVTEGQADIVFEHIPGAVDPDDFVVALHRTSSKDGTPLTLFVVHRRDLVPDGDEPTVLYGYGGFNIALTPSYIRNIQPFLAAGGVYAVAHLRGGGEYGEAWHKAGML
ncbi:MAG: prolyl oligopeptidase family serine peptidase, partial [Myxococcota bacterium]|nr:prolyl oligopeptidase family serine peptidase [Myxococcota bacterium]